MSAPEGILPFVMPRVAVVLLIAMAAYFSLPGVAAAATPSVEIQVAGVAEAVQLAPADAEAFQRRLNPPPAYAGPRPGGESFVVTTAYWDVALGTGAGGPRIEDAGEYFPDLGVVLLRQANRDLYFVLDLRQRAMLDRYIRLAADGSISGRPGALQVFAAASRSETIAVDVGGTPFEADGPRGFWNAVRLGDTKPEFQDPPAPPPGAEGYWFVVTTAEGRSLAYFYDTARQALTDALGTERYDARNLAAIGVLPPPPAETLEIEQQAPRGSKLWWPVMVGGGAALLSAAVWLRRRSPSAQSGM